MQLRNRLHRRESWYLLTAKVNREQCRRIRSLHCAAYPEAHAALWWRNPG